MHLRQPVPRHALTSVALATNAVCEAGSGRRGTERYERKEEKRLGDSGDMKENRQ
jgi:hypothetical protein